MPNKNRKEKNQPVVYAVRVGGSFLIILIQRCVLIPLLPKVGGRCGSVFLLLIPVVATDKPKTSRPPIVFLFRHPRQLYVR